RLRREARGSLEKTPSPRSLRRPHRPLARGRAGVTLTQPPEGTPPPPNWGRVGVGKRAKIPSSGSAASPSLTSPAPGEEVDVHGLTVPPPMASRSQDRDL